MRISSKEILHSSVIWVLVADEEQAQIYRYHKHKRTVPMYENQGHDDDDRIEPHDLTPLPGMAYKAKSLGDFQTERDDRGSLIAQLNSGNNTWEPYPDLCDEIAQQFVRKVASKINHYCISKAFDHLVIAAPDKILTAYKQQLESAVLKCIIAEVHSDFTNDRSHALLAHLQNTFAETRIG